MDFRLAVLACALVFAATLFSGCASQDGGGASAVPSAFVSVAASTSGGGNSLKTQKGDSVAVDYVGTLDDGTVFDTSLKAAAVKAGLPLRAVYSPLEFAVGAEQMIAGFDAAVIGMAEGEEKTVHLQPAEAYGEKRADLIVWVLRANVPSDAKIGSQLTSSQGMSGTVIEMNSTSIKIDFNPALAGKALNFRIILRKITRK
ncbi:MAG: FKBP-type peptidyl-prolyl cis-trans isomerase [Candidatus Micrarchaeota archaeon]